MLKILTIVNGPLEENCYLASRPGAGQGILIDPGSEPERIQAELEKAGVRPVLILATHAHFDHVGAVAALAEAYGAPFACHQADIPALESVEDMAAFYGWTGARTPRADRALKDGEVIEAADLRLKVLHTPGHTPGGVCFYHEESGNLFSGDTLFRFSVGRSDFEGGDALALTRSIRERIFSLPDSVRVWPGHGESTCVGDEKRGNPFVR